MNLSPGACFGALTPWESRIGLWVQYLIHISHVNNQLFCVFFFADIKYVCVNRNKMPLKPILSLNRSNL